MNGEILLRYGFSKILDIFKTLHYSLTIIERFASLYQILQIELTRGA